MLFKFPTLLFQILYLTLLANYTLAEAKKLGTVISFEAPMVAEGHSASVEPFWLESIKHQGKAAYNRDPTYQVFRNVKACTSSG